MFEQGSRKTRQHALYAVRYNEVVFANLNLNRTLRRKVRLNAHGLSYLIVAVLAHLAPRQVRHQEYMIRLVRPTDVATPTVVRHLSIGVKKGGKIS